MKIAAWRSQSIKRLSADTCSTGIFTKRSTVTLVSVPVKFQSVRQLGAVLCLAQTQTDTSFSQEQIKASLKNVNIKRKFKEIYSFIMQTVL